MNKKHQLFIIVAVVMFTCVHSDGHVCPSGPKGADPGSPPPVCLGACNCVAENCPGGLVTGVCDCTCPVCAKRQGNMSIVHRPLLLQKAFEKIIANIILCYYS